ncbi:tRNA threonylcarbamoyladenosine dehydratase [Hydrogenophaga electricum]|uniref:tRNA threonylcarbamoyladenosine dehydratase n=1 Tax=Hydrogenophaga electricum TaxID=1230953 RepID=A0ABQ6BY97_9BURK|nr:tRNA threonylcarbamoyladenosine dehydratase [Hydrogenophaga electricum]GLS12931.1 tRNA threonylcarbamoyladenosine dehydratase [Hydrogenophaga electricum]
MAPEFERRFGGLRRLYGAAGAQRLFDAHVAVVGIGGVGSWAVEALARSGVRRLTLIDLDHVAESNINRQIHASEATLGQAKAEAMRERIALYHPDAVVDVVDDFVTADNWPALMAGLPPPDALIDACDQVRAKTAMAAWALRESRPLVTVGAAGGKRLPQAVEVGDLAGTTHDPLLAKLRYQLRRSHGASREGRMGVTCVFSRENVAPPDAACLVDGAAAPGAALNCHGYGSAVSVTATFGLCAAGWVLNHLAEGRG